LREIGRVRLGNPNDTRILPVTRKMTTFHDGVNGSLYSRKLFFLRVGVFLISRSQPRLGSG
jgi:hypothetical protein